MPYAVERIGRLAVVGTQGVSASVARRKSKLPVGAKYIAIFVAILTLPLAMISLSPLAVIMSGVSLILIAILLWRADEPPILLLPPLFQWSEVAAFPLATTWNQMHLNDMSLFDADLEASAAYGFAGVVALAFGLRIGSRGRAALSFADSLSMEARDWRFDQVIRVGLGAMLAGYTFSILAGLVGPARELFGNAAGIKFVGIFIIAYWCQVNRQKYGLLAGITAFEVIFGMTGFFADFKNSLLTLIVAVIAARPRLAAADMVASALMAALVLFVASFWTMIKVDYRAFVNEGTGAQIVAVSMEKRLSFIAEAISDLEGAKLADGFNRLIQRHGYIDYLGRVLQSVPASIPHEDGKLTLDVISHITMPRIIFPNKPALLSDTDVTKKYTGLDYNWDENTSISIGNLGELYIDFGFFGGLLGEVVIGLIAALVYRTLRGNSGCPVVMSAGLCVMIALPLCYFGTAYIKLVGSFVFTSIIAVLVQRYISPGISRMLKLPNVVGMRMARQMRIQI